MVFPKFRGKKGTLFRCCLVVVYSTFRENIGVFILDIRTQFLTIKVLGIDDEVLGPCKQLICCLSDIPGFNWQIKVFNGIIKTEDRRLSG